MENMIKNGGLKMKKLIFDTSNITVDKAFIEFQRFNYSKNLREESINYYDNCFKYFRSIF